MLDHLVIPSVPHPLLQILENLKGMLQAEGVTLFALIDHSGEARKAGLNLQDEQLVIFGDPKAGALLSLVI